MFILVHEVKGKEINEVLINTHWIKHIKRSNGSSDTYIRVDKRDCEDASFFFVKESVADIWAMINPKPMIATKDVIKSCDYSKL